MDPHTPKVAIPFVSRAKELAKRDPVMSYWCKFMAAKVALDQLDSLNEDGRNALEGIMGDLEESKAALANNELVTDDAAGSAHIYNFASRVFEGADAADRAGKATRATAKEFLAASNFFETLIIFGPLETDVNEKITYAKWKASSIAKAFREGRTPTPGPAGGPAVPTAHEDAPTNDSSEDVASQLLGRPTGPTSMSPTRSQQSGTSGTAKANIGGATNIIDLSEDNDDEGGSSNAFSLPPPPSGDVYASRFLPSAPTDDNEDDTTNSPFPSVPSTMGGAPPPRAQTHPSAPPDVPSFPYSSSNNDFQDDLSPALPPAAPSQPPRSQQHQQPPSAPSVASPPPSSSYQPGSQNRQQQPPGTSVYSHSHSTSASYGTDARGSNGNNDDDDQWRPAPSSLDATTIATAQKHAKWAISALNYEDAETARKELRKALELIGG